MHLSACVWISTRLFRNLPKLKMQTKNWPCRHNGVWQIVMQISEISNTQVTAPNTERGELARDRVKVARSTCTYKIHNSGPRGAHEYDFSTWLSWPPGWPSIYFVYIRRPREAEQLRADESQTRSVCSRELIDCIKSCAQNEIRPDLHFPEIFHVSLFPGTDFSRKRRN